MYRTWRLGHVAVVGIAWGPRPRPRPRPHSASMSCRHLHIAVLWLRAASAASPLATERFISIRQPVPPGPPRPAMARPSRARVARAGPPGARARQDGEVVVRPCQALPFTTRPPRPACQPVFSFVKTRSRLLMLISQIGRWRGISAAPATRFRSVFVWVLKASVRPCLSLLKSFHAKVSWCVGCR